MSTDLFAPFGFAPSGPANGNAPDGTQFWGKYRASVVNNVDPQQMGRIQVDVAGVTTAPSTWAMPCVPVAGRSSGVFVLPAVGSGVWVEFEQGDPDFPIWTGGFWGGSSEVPSKAKEGLPVSPSTVIQSGAGHAIVLSDIPGPTGGIAITSASGAKITVSDDGITIDNGKGAKIELTGPSVMVNNPALVVR
jgi:uncharacterized protein involved in type VI secretion and phage assembly